MRIWKPVASLTGFGPGFPSFEKFPEVPSTKILQTDRAQSWINSHIAHGDPNDFPTDSSETAHPNFNFGGPRTIGISLAIGNLMVARKKQPNLLTPPEVARLLGISRHRVYQLITEGRLEAQTYGHVHLIPRSAALAYKRTRKPGRPKKSPNRNP